MKRGLLIAAASVPFGLWAQEAATPDTEAAESARERSRIIAFLEDNLSGAGRDIRIDGFKGLLSSTAEMAKLTISDAEGVWFTLEEAELNWDRAALLRGRLEVNEISAAKITLARLPSRGESGGAKIAAAPGARDFSLPDLPVAIDIGKIAAEAVTLGAPVLGLDEAVTLRLDGAAQLANGSGNAQLEVARTGGPDGQFRIDASYAAATEVFALDLDFSEAAGGLISTLSGLPGAPAIGLQATGEGPLDDLTVDLALSTDGAARLAGQVTLKGVAEGTDDAGDTPEDESAAAKPTSRRFEADIAGDLTPLFTPPYHAFFGQNTRLRAQGQTRPDAGADLSNFTLSTAAVTLAGSASFAAGGLPDAFALRGWIGRADREDVLLPFGENNRIKRADIVANFDAAEGDSWSAQISLQDGTFGTDRLAQATLNAAGDLTRAGTADVAPTALTALITGQTQGLVLADPALRRAVGETQSLLASLRWESGTPLVLDAFRAGTPGAELAGSGALTGFEEGFTFTGNAAFTSDELTRFSALTGQDLRGGLRAKLDGSYTLLGGQFDLTGTANGQNIAIGNTTVDPLIRGASQIAFDTARDETGITLRSASIGTPAVSGSAAGRLSTQSADLTVTAALDNVARIVPELTGPARLTAEIARTGAQADWQTQGRLTGPGGSEAQLSGTLSPDFDRANLRSSGTAPLGLMNRLTTSALVQGLARFDVSLNGPLALDSVTGQVDAAGARAVITSAGMSFTLPRATAQINGSQIAISALAEAQTGGSVAVNGTLDTGSFAADLRADLNGLVVQDPALYRTSVNGTLALTGPLSGGALASGALQLGRTDITVSPAAIGGSDALPDITHIGDSAAVRLTRDRAGLGGGGSSGTGSDRVINLDIRIDAPNQIFVRGRGLDAELGGALTLRGTRQNIVPAGQFSLIRGRLSLLGRRIDMEEGQITLQGNLDPRVRLVAATEADDLNVRIITEGALSAPELTLSSTPPLPDEEIFARLLFGRELSQISAFQAAQLAAAVATLTGDSGGVVGQVRDAFGLDDLDLQTSEEGTSAVRLGRYLSDTVYTDVTIDSEGKSVINLNLDASENVTVRGSASSDGTTGLGVFFEKDY